MNRLYTILGILFMAYVMSLTITAVSRAQSCQLKGYTTAFIEMDFTSYCIYRDETVVPYKEAIK